MSSYYDNPFAAAALELRIQAIEDIIAPGWTLVDLGCNDARIARRLLNANMARQVTAIDLNEQPPEPAPNLHFILADLLSFDLRALPKCDLVLALNVVHHLVLRSRSGARDLVQAALEISTRVVLDMGSFTEIGEWPWRLDLERHWSDDKAMWAELFGSAARHELLRYPAMNGGERVLWLLERPGDA